MVDYVPSEKGVSIRYPSTANLAIDSRDKTNGDSCNFIINKNNNIMTGFFTRIAVNEIVLDYAVPNVNEKLGTDTFTVFNINGNPLTTYTITLIEGYYNIKECLDEIVVLLNAAGSGITWTVVNPAPGIAGIEATGATFSVGLSTLANTLGFTESGPDLAIQYMLHPSLMTYQYLDFVSIQLTYCQDLKDNSTAPFSRDILYRWVFGWDDNSTVDAYGFPILQTYKPFRQRRYLNFPKQIKWDNIQPIGQLAFQVIGSLSDSYSVDFSDLNPISIGGALEYNINLLLSEV